MIVKDTDGSLFTYPIGGAGFKNTFTILLSDDGCGGVTFQQTNHAVGPFYVVQDTTLERSAYASVPAPQLSTTAVCVLIYETSISYTPTGGSSSVVGTYLDKVM